MKIKAKFISIVTAACMSGFLGLPRILRKPPLSIRLKIRRPPKRNASGGKTKG